VHSIAFLGRADSGARSVLVATLYVIAKLRAMINNGLPKAGLAEIRDPTAYEIQVCQFHDDHQSASAC
jgi:hypothetical protein